MRALHLHLEQDVWGHVIARLLQELTIPYDESLVHKAKVLDSFYGPTRYPDGHPAGAPFEHYGSLQSGDAIPYAGEILEFASSQMAQPEGR